MLLLYYNPTIKNYYLRYYKHIQFGYHVGYTNQFEHIVVKVLIIQDNGLVDVESVDDYCCKRYNSRGPSFKVRLKNRLIDFISKL